MPDEEVPAGYPEGFGEGKRERDALQILSTLRGLQPRKLHSQAWAEGSARGCLAAVLAGRLGSRADREAAATADASDVAAAAAASSARFVTPADDEYPPGLLDLQHDPPASFYVRGRRLDTMPDAIAVVGARRASALGREVSFDLGANLAGAGLCVISGAARGVDESSQRGALAVPGGTTVAVLGSGIDVDYPRGSAPLLSRILERHGAIVSEYAPGIPAEPFRFPARNRLIVALGRALVVVEGAEGSGSLISAEHALELGRDVFAVPGPVTSPLSAVPLALIRDGATLIRGADDLLADLGYDRLFEEAPPPELEEDERRVWECLANGSLPDAVARGAGLSIPDAVAVLIRLELRGLVRSVGGRYERRLSGGPKDPASSA